jgi:hypothetical protein
MSHIVEILDERFKQAGEKIYSIVTERILDRKSYLDVRDIVIETILTKRIEGLLGSGIEFKEVDIEKIVSEFRHRLDTPDYGVNNEKLAHCICHFFKKDDFIPGCATPPIELKPEDIFSKLGVEFTKEYFKLTIKYFQFRNIFTLSESLREIYKNFFTLLLTIGLKESNILSEESRIIEALFLGFTKKTNEPDLIERFFREGFGDRIDGYIEKARKDPFTYSFLISIYGGLDELEMVLNGKKSPSEINTDFMKISDEMGGMEIGEIADHFAYKINELYTRINTRDAWRKSIERALNKYFQNEISDKEKEIDKLISDKVVRKRISKLITLDVLKRFARECKSAPPDMDLKTIIDSISNFYYEQGAGFELETLRNWLQDNARFYPKIRGKTAQDIREFLHSSTSPEMEVINWYKKYLEHKGKSDS